MLCYVLLLYYASMLCVVAVLCSVMIRFLGTVPSSVTENPFHVFQQFDNDFKNNIFIPDHEIKAISI